MSIEGGPKNNPEDHEDTDTSDEQSALSKKMSRREFLRGAAVAGSGALAAASVPWWLKDDQEQQERGKKDGLEKSEEKHGQEQKERIPSNLLPHEQLVQNNEVDLESGMKAVFNDEYEHQMKVNDMEQAVENLTDIDMEKFVDPFPDRELPAWLSYMVAIQETRGEAVESWAGAVGVTGVMPYTAERFGYSAEDVKDPYIASEITARYLSIERDERFGEENTEMLLHAYNGGGGLAGFTGFVSRQERTPENFYSYMEEKINTEAKEKHQAGFHAYPFDQRCEGLSDVAKLFELTLGELQAANPDLDPRSMQYGDEIKIPLENASGGTWREIFRGYFETLYYVPEIYGKHTALADKGLIEKIEASA